jgi:hypothetical protein
MGDDLSEAWDAYCHRGRYNVTDQRRSVRRCLGPDGIVRGWYSDLPLLTLEDRTKHPSEGLAYWNV